MIIMFVLHVVRISCFLDTSLDMVEQFTIDAMHGLYQNWMKRFLKQVHQPFCRTAMSSAQFKQMGEVWGKRKFPVEIGRQPRSFDLLPRFKATELRNLLLYGGDHLLDGKASGPVLHIFRLFMLAVRILSDKDLCQNEVSTCSQTLNIYKFLHYFCTWC